MTDFPGKAAVAIAQPLTTQAAFRRLNRQYGNMQVIIPDNQPHAAADPRRLSFATERPVFSVFDKPLS